MRFTQLLEAKLACCLHMNDIRHEYRMKALDALCFFINLFGMLFSTKGLHVIILVCCRDSQRNSLHG